AGRDHDEPVMFVEGPRTHVGLEAIQVEAVRASGIGGGDQPAADAGPDPIRGDVELVDHVGGEAEERDDAAIGLGRHPHLVLRRQLGRQPGADIVVGVARREVEGRVPGREPDVAHPWPIALPGWPDRDRGEPLESARLGVAVVGRHRVGSLLAAASSRIQTAPSRRASVPGHRRGSRSGPKMSATTAAFSAPETTTITWRATPMTAGLSVTRSTCGSMWV